RRTISKRLEASAGTFRWPIRRSAVGRVYDALSGSSWSRNQSRSSANDSTGSASGSAGTSGGAAARRPARRSPSIALARPRRGGRLEQRLGRRGAREPLRDPAGGGGGEEGVAAERKEAVVAPDAPDCEERAPQAGEDLFGRRPYFREGRTAGARCGRRSIVVA